ncbi:PSD1 and planctomycete cytochrome C domain-containing protein [Blastopirellula marina]|nr:PSD1 and planctomycete cytochrome C domain-containing protein [Blastopirellula marina]
MTLLVLVGIYSFNIRAEEVDYSRDIKPLLSNSCYTCHGPDEHTREADLRLDVRGSAVHSAIAPGKPNESELLARIASTDPDTMMPPPKSHRPQLTENERKLVRQWIAKGAKFNEHWAYTPASRPEVPAEFNSSPIDYFITQQLDKAGMQPAPTADPRTLLRRLYFDLTGLPPTPREVAAFMADPSDQAYQAAVDRLLASPHFGERMAIHWLDLVRYADSVGIHGDQEWSMSPYRDYVIRSFNENKPFDLFTREQLAGDLLPDATLQQQVASGYNRLNMITAEGGAQAKEYLAKYAADRVRTTSTVWLGATMGCCECHDHKFDPFTTKEFYQFAAYFADLEERGVYNGSSRTGNWGPEIRVPTNEQAAQQNQLDQEIAKLEAVLNTPTLELAEDQKQWEATLPETPTWQVLPVLETKSTPEVTWKTLEDGSLLAGGNNPDKVTYEITLGGRDQKVTAVRLEVFPHDSLPANGPGRAGNGNFVLNRFSLAIDGKPLEFSAATATHQQEGWAIANLLGKDANKGWAVLPQTGKTNLAVFELPEDISLSEDSKLSLTMQQAYGSGHAIGRFRVAVIEAPRPVKAGQSPGVPSEIRQLVELPAEKRTEAERETLASYYHSIAPRLEQPRQQLLQRRQQRESLLNAMTTSLVSRSVAPRTMRVLPRGNWLDESGEVVDPQVPGFLGYEPETEVRQSRLDLADWLVDPRNPLTARVFVNRIWQLTFGKGLVATSDDFGSQGALPSHRQLLDWLAVEFVESGWDIKHMVRLMVLSDAYQRSSVRTSEQREFDPQNQWLAAQSHFRLPAEMIRDNALSASGLLVDKLGGESARPYQPAGYWSHLNFPRREYQADQGEGLYRRGLYTHWQRTYLHPSLGAFDAPTREECTARRTVSNTPLQALVLMNDPTYIEAARALAVRVLTEGGDTWEAKANFAMQAVLQRDASAAETEVLRGLYTKHQQQYADDAEARAALAKVGAYQVPDGIDAVELAAWTSVCRTLLNLHETINRY